MKPNTDNLAKETYPDKVWKQWQSLLRKHSTHPVGCACENKDVEEFIRSLASEREKLREKIEGISPIEPKGAWCPKCCQVYMLKELDKFLRCPIDDVMCLTDVHKMRYDMLSLLDGEEKI